MKWSKLKKQEAEADGEHREGSYQCLDLEVCEAEYHGKGGLRLKCENEFAREVV